MKNITRRTLLGFLSIAPFSLFFNRPIQGKETIPAIANIKECERKMLEIAIKTFGGRQYKIDSGDGFAQFSKSSDEYFIRVKEYAMKCKSLNDLFGHWVKFIYQFSKVASWEFNGKVSKLSDEHKINVIWRVFPEVKKDPESNYYFVYARFAYEVVGQSMSQGAIT